MPTEAKAEALQKELAKIVESVFGAMMGLEASECGPTWFPGGDRLAASVALAGEWNGTLMLECNRKQACRFAGRFLSIAPPGRVDDVVCDVLGELANMIGGNLKGALTRGLRLSTPCILEGGDCQTQVCRAKACERLAFRSAEGPFRVALLAADAE